MRRKVSAVSSNRNAVVVGVGVGVVVVEKFPPASQCLSEFDDDAGKSTLAPFAPIPPPSPPPPSSPAPLAPLHACFSTIVSRLLNPSRVEFVFVGYWLKLVCGIITVVFSVRGF